MKPIGQKGAQPSPGAPGAPTSAPPSLILALGAAWILLSISLTQGNWAVWGKSLGTASRAFLAGFPYDFGALIASSARHASGLVHLALLLLAGLGAGALLVPVFGLRLRALPRAALQLTAGMSVVSLFQQGLGYAGLLFPSILWTETAMLIAGGAVSVIRAHPWSSPPKLSASSRLPAVMLLALLAVCFALTRLPNTHEDPMCYHFAAPEQYLSLHKINAEPQHSQWHYPLACEMAFMVPWHAGGIELAKLVNVVFLIAGLMVIFCLAGALRRKPGSESPPGSADQAHGWWAAFWFSSAGMVVDLCWQGKNDLSTAIFAAAAGWSIAEALGNSPRWWLAAGWFLGAAVATKLTAGFLVIGAVFVFILFMRRKASVPGILAISAVSAVPIAGWTAANYLYLGNPVPPFLSGFFPTLAWDPSYSKALHNYLLIVSPLEALAKRDQLAGIWRVFGDPNLGSAALFALLPLVFLATRGRASLGLKLAAIVVYVLWTFTERSARFLFPLSAWVAAMAGSLCFFDATPIQRWIPAARNAIAAAALIGAAGKALSIVPESGWLYLLGQRSRDSYMEERYSTWWKVRNWVNRDVSPSATLLFTWESRRLWFKPRVISAHTVTEPLFWKYSRESWNAGEMRKRVKQRGITHNLHNLVVAEYRGTNWFPGPAWTERQLAVYKDFVRLYCRPVYSPPTLDHVNGGFYVFEISRRPSASGYPLLFLPFTEGRFAVASWLANTGRVDDAYANAQIVFQPVMDVTQAQSIMGGLSQKAARKDQEAIDLLEPGIRMGFVGDGNWTNYGLALAGVKRYDRALKAFVKAFLLYRQPIILNSAAFCLLKLGEQKLGAKKPSLALRDFEQALACQTESSPYLAPAHAYSAYALSQLGNLPLAAEHIRRALKLEPRNKSFKEVEAMIKAKSRPKR